MGFENLERSGSLRPGAFFEEKIISIVRALRIPGDRSCSMGLVLGKHRTPPGRLGKSFSLATS